MSVKTSKELIAEGYKAVSSASYCPKKLTAIHTGIAAGVSFLVALLTYLLGTGIGDTGGLSGIGLRAALETAQSTLQIAISVLSPFWSLGFIAAVLCMMHGQEMGPRTLLQGFRHFGVVLRMLLLQAVMYVAVIILFAQLGSIIYTFTPFSQKLDVLVDEMVAVGATDTEAIMAYLTSVDPQIFMGVFWSLIPFMALPVLIAVVILSYRLRLAQFLVMDNPRMGAMLATFGSMRLTKRNCLRLLKLDLRFWWFYALEVLVQVLCYGDVLLPLFGVELGMNVTLASFLFFALALVCQVGLYVWKKPQIFASYAAFYNDLLPKQEDFSEPETV